MSIHIHLFDCNCIFCASDFPLDFFQTQDDHGPNTQSATTPKEVADPLDDDSDLDDDDWDDDEDDEEEDNDEEEDDDEDEDDPPVEPKPEKTNKKKLFGFLIGNHDVCVL